MNTLDDRNKLLLKFLQTHRDDINLSELARKSKINPSLLSRILVGQRTLTTSTATKIRPVLDSIVEKYPKEDK